MSGSLPEGTLKLDKEARSEGKNIPERRDSMCKSLGAGMSLPRTETLERRARSPTSWLLRWQTELRKTSYWGFRTMHAGCFREQHPAAQRCPWAVQGQPSHSPLGLLSADSCTGSQAMSPLPLSQTGQIASFPAPASPAMGVCGLGTDPCDEATAFCLQCSPNTRPSPAQSYPDSGPPVPVVGAGSSGTFERMSLGPGWLAQMASRTLCPAG